MPTGPVQLAPDATACHRPVSTPPAAPPPARPLSSLWQLLALPVNQLAGVPVELANLLCADLLPDTGHLDIGARLMVLDEMARAVLAETRRNAGRFRADPADYDGSEAVYRMVMLVTVVQADFGVTYDADAVERKTFASSGEGFIHSLLSPRTADRRGTCANLPVLYAAVARRLGYPLYLACAKGHLFCRWHDARTGERFNVEGSGRGMSNYGDEHYMAWPHPIDPVDVRSGLFLKDLTPAQELACFLTTRGHVLLDRHPRHTLEAITAYAHAHWLDPTDPHHMQWLMAAVNREMDARADGTLPGTYRAGESAEYFNQEGVLPVTRYVLDNAMHRVAGIHPPAGNAPTPTADPRRADPLPH